MSRIQLFSVDNSLARRLGDALGERVTVSMVQSLESAGFDGPGIIVIDHAAISADRSLASSISAIAHNAQGRAIVLATDDLGTDQVLQAIRAGASDIIPREATGEDVSSVLSRLLSNAVATQGVHGRLTLVLGADREAAAILATDVALALARHKAPGLLIDCTLPTSAAETYLDLKAAYGIASAIGDIERLDASLLSDALARHEPTGLSLLTLDGGTSSEPAGIGPNDIVGLIQLLRACYDNVVLCAGSLRHMGLLREMASQAHDIEIVCRQSIRELDGCRRMLEQMDLDPSTKTRMRLAVWDHDPAVLLDGRRMADTMGLEQVLPVPIDRIRTANAFNAGKPIMAGPDHSPYGRAVLRAANIHVQEKRGTFGMDKVRRALLRSVERAA